MSEKKDRKLESVVLAQYHYRHEAEFAAGFLDDAGIPYRLQVDDAGMGMTISTPATLWVLGIHLNDAAEILDLPHRRDAYLPAASGGDHSAIVEYGLSASDDGSQPYDSVPDDDSPPGYDSAPGLDRRFAAPVRRDVSATVPFRDVNAHRLTVFERLLAAVLLVGDIGAMALAPGLEFGAIWVGVLAAVGAPLAAAAVVGRTFPPVRRLLRAISGSAP